MLYEYKIQKLLNGNNEIRYSIKYKSLGVSWINKKLNKWFYTWVTLSGIFKSIEGAQEAIEIELRKDRAKERAMLAKQNKVLEEYNYKMIPNHIPNEQIETYLTYKEESNDI